MAGGSDEGFLHQIPRLLPIPADPKRQSKEATMVEVEQPLQPFLGQGAHVAELPAVKR